MMESERELAFLTESSDMQSVARISAPISSGSTWKEELCEVTEGLY